MPRNKRQPGDSPLSSKMSKSVKWRKPVAVVAPTENSDYSNTEPPHPLLIRLVILNILKNLELEDLKECRSVCKTWEEVASTIIPHVSEVRLYCARKTKKVKADSKSITKFGKFLSKSARVQLSPFKVTNLTISRFGQDETSLCLCDESIETATCSIVKHFRSTLQTLNLENVSTSTFNKVLRTVILHFPRLQSLNITYYDDFQEHHHPALGLPIGLSPLTLLNVFCIENSGNRYFENGITMDWSVFWGMCPRMSEVTLKDNYKSLAAIIGGMIPFCKQLPLAQLNMIALDPYCEVGMADRKALAETIGKVIGKLPLKELILDLNLSLVQWSIAMAGNLPDSLTRLCINSDFCMGTDYSENPHNQFMEGDSTDRILSILGPGFSVPKTLSELSFYFNGAKGMDKTVRISPATLRLDGVRDLSWICVRRGSSSWESLFRNGLEDVAAIFPNIRRLETTIGTKKALRQLFTLFPNLEELIISEYSKLKLSDSDVIGEKVVFSPSGTRRIIKNLGFPSFKKLHSLTLESDCRNLTDLSIFDGFLKMPTLNVLEIYEAPVFGADAMQTLIDQDFLQLSIEHD